MDPKKLPDLDYLRQCLRYYPETGHLTWAPDRRRIPNRRAGSEFDGCLMVWLEKAKYRVHRVVWKLYYGEEPPPVIDHINGDPFDNRIANLRGVSQRENCCNKVVKTGKYGRGVDKKDNRYRAYHEQAGRSPKRIYLGYFKTPEEAEAARERYDRGLGIFTERHLLGK